MPRPLRLQFPHAIYHVINRGNFRTALFASEGAARSFEQCLFEAAQGHHWRLHAFAIMINHFHLAVETPEANLTESVHWLESTFGTRFNRYRKERGHLFQGRYHAGLVQPGPSLLRVVNYIHLNPVRAGVVDVSGLPGYRWSSLRHFLRNERPDCLACAEWLRELQLADDAEGWQAYGQMLLGMAKDHDWQEQEGFPGMDGRWAIGNAKWRREILASFREVGVAEAPFGPERDAIRMMRWTDALDQALRRQRRTRADLLGDRKGAEWKIALAAEMRQCCGATHRWLARELHLGKPSSVRAYLCRRNKLKP